MNTRRLIAATLLNTCQKNGTSTLTTAGMCIDSIKYIVSTVAMHETIETLIHTDSDGDRRITLTLIA